MIEAEMVGETIAVVEVPTDALQGVLDPVLDHVVAGDPRPADLHHVVGGHRHVEAGAALQEVGGTGIGVVETTEIENEDDLAGGEGHLHDAHRLAKTAALIVATLAVAQNQVHQILTAVVAALQALLRHRLLALVHVEGRSKMPV
mmetsp:Transcript_5723/g.10916  ORF Transcript_5723/g.10916 Transcript_5723/m.10916 type:complete len:145 (+) Transcript_5723:442-876(+)